ncbi:hypothetical protein E6Q11_00680 [Candidatus Dojkabacteria bacterium]|uniref:Uncharacterized protein n=1 Tax=Candidatus Dojkabacteria bacterium TaxID=2099670 RepID=A0A5C7JAQ7_9BACT|nr:MAG: hypothetical protein E6Q11_00680 [Candidatus Dojkabacteria bacterium]
MIFLMPKIRHKNKKKSPYLTHRRVIITIFATVGVVAVWRGIWITFDHLPYFDNPLVAIALALGILIVAAVYFRKIDFF